MAVRRSSFRNCSKARPCAIGAGPMPVRKAVAYAVAIARGLAAAHEKGITHRDLKPENLFVTTADHVKILDFGLAKLTSDAPADSGVHTVAQTGAGVVLGTVGYMSPEQVRGLPADHRADLFALGAVLYSSCRASAHSGAIRPSRRWRRLSTSRRPPSAHRASDPAGPHADHRALSRKESDRTVPNRKRSGVRARGLVRGVKFIERRRGSRAADAAIAGWAAAAAAVALAALAPFAYQRFRERPSALSPIRFQISPTVELSGAGNFGLSPDGRQLAFFGVGDGWAFSGCGSAQHGLAGDEQHGSRVRGLLYDRTAPVLFARLTFHRVRRRWQAEEIQPVRWSTADLV